MCNLVHHSAELDAECRDVLAMQRVGEATSCHLVEMYRLRLRIKMSLPARFPVYQIEKPREEYDLPAIMQEKILAYPQSRFLHAKVGAVAYQHSVAKFAPDPERDDITGDARSHRNAHDRPDIQIVRLSGVYGRAYEDGFTGHRNANTFQRDRSGYQPKAIK